ncbi:MAG TPA: hypothetical protein VFT89_07490 [Rhizobiaceae bacterium]|nr:hypothetical protein [Rhizobiaceae bacterium]
MTRDHDGPPPTEPEIIHCVFCSGISVEVGDGYVRIVGCVDLPVMGHERRIVARLVMPPNTARHLIRDLQRGLHRGSH